MEKLNCDIVRDLLPNYMEKLTSPSTDAAIEEHLEGCIPCQAVYEGMKEDIPVAPAPEDVPVKKFLTKVKSRYAMDILSILGAIAVIICVIVNLAVDKKLSWSLIVTGAIIYFLATTKVFISSPKNKIENSLLCISILLLPFLGLIQIVLTYLMTPPSGIWFWKTALPISLIWMIVIWMWVILTRILKCNWFTKLGIFTLMVIPANILTNVLAGSYQSTLDIIVNFYANGLATLLLSIIFFVIGFRRRRNQ